MKYQINYLLPAFLFCSANILAGESVRLNGHSNSESDPQNKKEGIYAEFTTSKGKIVIILYYDKAPVTVANFIGLAEGTITNASFPKGKSFYSGSVWHRVVKGHVIQGGSPSIDKAPEKEEVSATGYVIPNEISDLSHSKAGMLGMANSGPHTNTCQYYITLGDRSYLDGNYTLFGEVKEGMDVVNSIIQGDTTYSIKINRIGRDAKKFIVNDKTFRKLLDEQWEKVKTEETARRLNDERFIDENYPDLDSLSGGLRYKILAGGTGEKPAKGSVLTVLYSGRLINGTTFISTKDAGRPAPGIDPARFSFISGKDQVIKGLEISLADMKQGEIRVIVIPPALAYGNNGFYARDIPGQKRFVISPGEILILEVTLLGID